MIAFGLYDTCKCIAARKYGTECSAVPWEQIYMLLNGNFGWDRDSSHGPSRIDPALRSATSSEPQGRAPYYSFKNWSRGDEFLKQFGQNI